MTSPMKFCGECNNLMIHKENKERRALVYACRTCGHEVDATNNCVYRHEIGDPESERNWRNVAAELTLPRTKAVRCPRCQHEEAFFRESSARDDEPVTFICCKSTCGHRWKE